MGESADPKPPSATPGSESDRGGPTLVDVIDSRMMQSLLESLNEISHLGNIFPGRFFHDDDQPDVELFRAQARRYGFDEAEYLAALERVPRCKRETADALLSFCSKLAGVISSRAPYPRGCGLPGDCHHKSARSAEARAGRCNRHCSAGDRPCNAWVERP